MQAITRRSPFLGPLVLMISLASCGGQATPSAAPASPASSAAAAASKPEAASAAPASKPAAASPGAASVSAASASAKPAASGPAAASGAAAGSAAAKPAASGGAVTLPTLPGPVAVSLDPKASAFLVLDINMAVCQPNPVCMGTVPAISAFLKKARDAKMPVVYSTTGTPPNPVVSEVAPQQGEQTVSGRADKFINTDLDSILKNLGAKTLLIVGSASNGAVLYTSFHANALGYTVAVATDGISAREPFATFEAEFQLLNQPGFTNADNKPLAPNMVTLTTTPQVTIK